MIVVNFIIPYLKEKEQEKLIFCIKNKLYLKLNIKIINILIIKLILENLYKIFIFLLILKYQGLFL